MYTALCPPALLTARFLPYTVKFEVAPDECESYLPLPSALTTPQSSLTPQPVVTASILPSLSKASTAAHTPSGSPPHAGKRDKIDPGSAELFFAKARKPATELADTVSERLSPHLIQPRLRFQQPVVPKLVVESKKRDDTARLAGLTISRSLTSLAAHPGLSRSGSATGDFPGLQRSRPSVSRGVGFSLGNGSNTSLVIAEEDEAADARAQQLERQNFERLHFDGAKVPQFDGVHVDGDGRELAPYGGFSRPDLEETFLRHTSVFDLAPWQVVKTDKGNGSLTKAVQLAHQRGAIRRVKWVGTMALPSDALLDKVMGDISERLHRDYDCESVVVNDITFQGHYKLFCKQILWPTLHYQIPDDPKLKAFEEHSYHHYRLLNQLVADKLVETYRTENGHLAPDDPENMIWIHDYHLLLVPRMVREQLPHARIGFFLHVSFPSSEVFRCLAQRNALLEGMLGADCITFQTKEYVRHFLQTCTRILLADASEFGLTHDGVFTRVNTIPVGIDAEAVEKELASDAVVDWKQMITERWKSEILIVSRDKLDKLRGVKQKLLAYERFLQQNPEYVEKTVLIQIFIGADDDDDYESEVLQIASRINSMAENISDTQPVVTLHNGIEFDQYLALLSEADMFVVSSMREGLNLTCHEFVVAAGEKKSPLVLSEFTGSSNLLGADGEGALLINPWDIKEFSETLKRGLTMSKDEKELHWATCHSIVIEHDSMDWVRGCMKSINDAWTKDQQKSTNSTPFSHTIFSNFYEASKGRRLFVINLDNSSTHSTLYGSTLGSRDAYLEFARIGSLLTVLISDPSNCVYVTSVMKRSEMESIFKNTSNIGLMAECGGFVRVVGESKWLSIIDETEVGNWKPQVTLLIQAKSERLPGSSAIVEDCTVRLLADSSMAEDPKRSFDVMGDCMQHINEAYEETEGVHATIVGKSVVVQQKDITLRALSFLLTLYTTDTSMAALTEDFKMKRVKSSSDTLFQSLSPIRSESEENNTEYVTSLFFAGGLNPLDETVFDNISNFEKDGIVDTALTVAVRGGDEDARSSATYSVLGQNELFGILSKINTR